MTPDPAASARRSELAGLLVLLFATFVAVTSEMMPIGLLPVIADDLAIDEGRAGMLVSLYAAIVVLLAVPLTSVLRRVPGKYVLLATMVGYLVANLVFATAPDYALMAVGRVIGGATHAVFFSVSIGYATRLVPAARMGRALALVSAGTAAGLVIGSPLATAVGNATGWRSAAWLMAGLSVVGAVLMVVWLPFVAPPARGSTVRTSGRSAHAVAALGANTLVFLGHFGLYTYVAVLLLRAGVQEDLLAVFLLLFGFFGVGAIFVAGPYLDRRAWATSIVVLGVMAGSMFLLGVLSADLLAVVVLGTVWNACYGPTPAVFQSAAVRTHAFSPEVAGAWVNATSNLGIAVGSLLGGLIVVEAGTGMLALVASLVVAAGLVIIVAVPKAFSGEPALPASG